MSLRLEVGGHAGGQIGLDYTRIIKAYLLELLEMCFHVYRTYYLDNSYFPV